MITTLTGNNHFLISQKLGEIVGNFTKQYGALSVERFEGEESSVDRINESLQNLPFLIEKKLIVLRDPSRNKEFNETIEQIISSTPDTTEVVIVESKLDKRSSYFKTLKAETNFEELNELDQQSTAKWLQEEAKKLGGSISNSGAWYLIDRVGNNQQLLSNELIKLLTYKPDVTKETIDLLTEATPQSNVFDLLEAAFSGNVKRTLELYDEQRRLKVEPLAIMALIGWQLHIIALIKTAGRRSNDEIAKEARIGLFVVRKSNSVAKKISLEKLKELLRTALELDVRLKSQAIDPDEALKHFLLSLSS